MTKTCRRFSSEFKFRVTLEAAKGQQTLSELASKHSLHPNQMAYGPLCEQPVEAAVAGERR